MNINDLLDKLSGLKNGKITGSQWTALCPAHEDNHASLSIGIDNGKILLKCHVGCKITDICSKLGITLSDLMDASGPTQSSSKKQIEATYDYTDENGKLIYQTVRFYPKSFRQQRPDANGGIIYNIKGISPLPYKLPKLLDAVRDGHTVFIAEGEKDCDKLSENGFTATCNSGGAGKWYECHSQWLKGAARISIISDKDDPGRNHAIAVAISVSAFCDDVHAFQLPNLNGSIVKDAYDWFKFGGSKEQLAQIEAKLPPFDKNNPFPELDSTDEHWSLQQLASYNVGSDSNAIIGFKDGLVTRYLCKGYGAWIIGQSGIGKSTLSQQQGFCWSLGIPFCGIHPIKPRRILIVQNENDLGDAAEATQGILTSLSLSPDQFDLLQQNLKIIRCRGRTGDKFCRWLDKEINAWHAEIVYVDPLIRFAGIDVSRQDQCTKFLNDCLDPVLANTGVVLIGSHHTGKPKNTRDTQNWTIYDHAYAGIGSSELVNWARAISIIRVLPGSIFELLLAKRGSRAWATHQSGEFTTSIFLQHSKDKIFWNQIPPPELPPQSESKRQRGGRPSKTDQIAFMNLHSFCSACIPEGEGLNVISKRLEQWLAKQRIDASPNTCKRAIVALVANAKLQKTDLGLYVKGQQA